MNGAIVADGIVSGGYDRAESKCLQQTNAEWDFLVYLRDAGRDVVSQWLEAQFDDIGKRTTFEFSGLFEESLRPAHLAEGTIRKKKRETES